MITRLGSSWGLKDSGADITNNIIDIVAFARSFIIVGGYNFSFRHAGMTLFNELTRKVNNGIPVLLIFPPSLAGRYNPQPRLIDYCITNNIGVILNRNHHAKWLLTERDLYYGSSNFTPTSWRDRVEVITIHNNTQEGWKHRTSVDFLDFVEREIADINNQGRNMNLYPGLIQSTIDNWNRIRHLVMRFNPSIEKVKNTLENYEKVELLIYFTIEEWFKKVGLMRLYEIYEMNAEILSRVNRICEYAYANIYNESSSEDNVENLVVINRYNRLYENFERAINKQLEDIKNMNFPSILPLELNLKNQNLILSVAERLKDKK